MKTVFVDIDTQIDFMFPAGALYVPGAEKSLPVIGHLNRHAPLLISTMDAHAENDPEFTQYPPHCVAGTLGQHKPAAALRSENQFIITKQTLDCFLNPKLDALLREMNADRYVVYGVVAEICVRYAAFGLLKYSKPVAIVTDAIVALDPNARDQMLSEFQARGGSLTTATQEI